MRGDGAGLHCHQRSEIPSRVKSRALQLSGPETVAGTLSGAPPTETGPADFDCRTIRLRIAADSP